jgi:hypothetical protein
LSIPPAFGATGTPNAQVSDALGAYGAAHILGDYFTENRGQTTDGVRFYSGGNPAVAFRDDGVLFVWREAVLDADRADDGLQAMTDMREFVSIEPPEMISHSYLLRFDGMSSHDPDGVIVNYSFDFDDGTVLEGTAVFRDHTYEAAGMYNVALSVRDDDGNTSIAWAVVVVDPPTKEPNWKPLVALLFSITLGLLGIWSSRKHPWKGVPTREAALKTWCCTALPFSVAEAVTGIVSLLTGQLGIPPVMGLGTVVDVMIFGVGIGMLVVLAYTGRRDEDAAQ